MQEKKGKKRKGKERKGIKICELLYLSLVSDNCLIVYCYILYILYLIFLYFRLMKTIHFMEYITPVMGIGSKIL